MNALFQDLRYGARMLVKQPGFTAVAVLTLALGLAVNATILGMIEAFVENPYTPDSVLIEIASSPTMQLVQHDVARSAREILQVRADLREPSSTYDDMAPS